MADSEATIFLSGSRACTRDNTFRSYHTLNEPFFTLVSFNDETLAARARARHEANTILIPLVGELEFDSTRVGPGQIIVLNNTAEISNPYKEELINYLSFKVNSLLPHGTVDFNIDTNHNQLIQILPGIGIGKFTGRRDGVHTPDAGTNGVFAFVIEGVFEVQNRLLHSRDGLALTNVKEVEFEALSNEAILLILNT